MGVAVIVSAVIVGLIIGGLGRLVLPGRQPIGLLMTILVGVVAAFIGSAIGVAVHAGTALTVVIEVVLAAVLVSLLSGRGRYRRV